jgi:hypothetical protein
VFARYEIVQSKHRGMLRLVTQAIQAVLRLEELIHRLLDDPVDFLLPVLHDHTLVQDLRECALPDVEEVQAKSISIATKFSIS